MKLKLTLKIRLKGTENRNMKTKKIPTFCMGKIGRRAVLARDLALKFGVGKFYFS